MSKIKNSMNYILSQDVYNKESKEFEVKEVPFDIDKINAKY
jgi:hypothetical protein